MWKSIRLSKHLLKLCGSHSPLTDSSIPVLNFLTITLHLEAIRNTYKLLIIQRNIENSLLSEVREVLMTNRWADRLTNILGVLSWLIITRVVKSINFIFFMFLMITSNYISKNKFRRCCLNKIKYTDFIQLFSWLRLTKFTVEVIRKWTLCLTSRFQSFPWLTNLTKIWKRKREKQGVHFLMTSTVVLTKLLQWSADVVAHCNAPVMMNNFPVNPEATKPHLLQ